MNYAGQKIAAGDTADPMLVGAQISNVLQDMSDAGWECQVALIDADRNAVSTPRAITELVASDGVQKFRVTMTIAEADLMSATTSVVKYIWTAQVTNLALNYRREVDVELTVRSNAIP